MAILQVLVQDQVVHQLSLPGNIQSSPLQFLVPADKSPDLVNQPTAGYLAALIMIGGHWVLMARPGGEGISVNRVSVISLRMLDHDDKINLPGFELRFVAKVIETLSNDSILIKEGKACPWCQCKFRADDKVIFCPVCGMANHASCLDTYGKCGSYPFCGYLVREETL